MGVFDDTKVEVGSFEPFPASNTPPGWAPQALLDGLVDEFSEFACKTLRSETEAEHQYAALVCPICSV
jgi:hypothetical protein